MTGPAAPAAPSRHLPALDGLRALAVAGVLAFHSELPWARGGYLGVSLFFTLSGFLITRLLLSEHAAKGRIDLRRFWSRRLRRLLPAAMAGIALGLAVGAVIGDRASMTDLRGDALAALAHVVNWRFILANRGYADLFQAPSPLQHLWSLAIEEQLYLVVPLVLVVAGRRGRRTLVASLGALVVASAVTAVRFRHGLDRSYYGTDARAVELLIGALLAAVLHGRPALRAVRPRQAAAALALGGLVLTWWQVELLDPNLFRGLILGHAVLVVVVLLALESDGPLTSALSWAPLRWIGTRSYGIYLYHWPLFLLLTADRTGIQRPWLHLVRIAAVLAVSEVSYRVVETPVRTGRWLRPTAAWGAALAAGGALAAVAIVAPRLMAEPPIDFAGAQRHIDEATRSTTTTQVGARTLAIYGDSTALLTGAGLTAWAQDNARWVPVPGVTAPGCPLTPDGQRLLGDQVLDIAEGCAPAVAWPAVLTETAPDVVLIESGNFDLLPWRSGGRGDFLQPTDPAVVPVLRAAIADATALLLEHAGKVVWVTIPPRVNTDPQSDAAFALWNGLVRDLDGSSAGRVVVVDLAAWLADQPGGLADLELRPDGTHFTEETSRRLADLWLGEAVATAAGIVP